MMDANGNNQVRLTFNEGLDMHPVWSFDGSRILFTSERDGSRDIFVMDPSGSNQVALTREVESNEMNAVFHQMERR